jgi:hypothetical protein
MPTRFGADNNAWKTLHMHPHNQRCLLNIDLLEQSLVAAGFTVLIADFGNETAFGVYADVVKEMQRSSIFIGVEGSGSLHSLWLPQGRAGFLQLSPKREGRFGVDNVDLFTESWAHYYGMCVHNWRLGRVYETPVSPQLLAAAVGQMYQRLVDKTCLTCLVDPATAFCVNLTSFN